MYLDKRKMWVVAEWGGVAVVVVGGVRGYGGGGVWGSYEEEGITESSGTGSFLTTSPL